MPNDNVLTDERRIELAIFHRILGRDGNGDATRSYGSKDDVLNLCRAIESEVLAAHPGRPEPRAEVTGQPAECPQCGARGPKDDWLCPRSTNPSARCVRAGEAS